MPTNDDADRRSQLGWFWLPDTPDERLAGIVESDENSIWIRLLGMFAQDEAHSYSIPTGVVHAAVLGELQNPCEPYTAHGASLWLPGHEYSVMRAKAGVAGAHNSENQLVRRVRFRMDLDLLVARPLTEAIYTSDVDLFARVDLLKVPPLEIAIPNGTVTIGVHPVIRSGQAGKPVELDVSHQVDVAFSDPVAWNTLSQHAIQPLRQLITLMRAARPAVHDVSFAADTDTTLTGAPHLARRLDWPSWLRGRDAQTRRAEPITFGTIRHWEGNELELGILLQRWWAWATREENRRVLNSLNRTAATESRSPHDEFSDAISALEEFANRFEPDRSAHNTRVSRLMAHIPHDDPDRGWAQDRMRSGGGLGFGKKLRMARDSHPSGRGLLGDDAGIEEIATARHKLSHGDYPAGFDLIGTARRICQYIAVLAVGSPAP